MRMLTPFFILIVLAKGTETKIGQLAFYGGIEEAREFFGVPTMEEVVRQINAKNEGGEGRADEYIEKFKVYSAEREKNTEAAFDDADRSEEAALDTVLADVRRHAAGAEQADDCTQLIIRYDGDGGRAAGTNNGQGKGDDHGN